MEALETSGLNMEEEDRDRVGAVSYTHLDVYKRQVIIFPCS